MCVPNILVFRKILERLTSTPEVVQSGKKTFEDQHETHIRHAVNALKLSYRTIWRIVRKHLKYKARELSAWPANIPDMPPVIIG